MIMSTFQLKHNVFNILICTMYSKLKSLKCGSGDYLNKDDYESKWAVFFSSNIFIDLVRCLHIHNCL